MKQRDDVSSRTIRAQAFVVLVLTVLVGMFAVRFAAGQFDPRQAQAVEEMHRYKIAQRQWRQAFREGQFRKQREGVAPLQRFVKQGAISLPPGGFVIAAGPPNTCWGGGGIYGGIYSVTREGFVTSLVAGDSISYPHGVAIHSVSRTIYVTTSLSVDTINLDTGAIQTVVRDYHANFMGVAVDLDGTVIVTDEGDATDDLVRDGRILRIGPDRTMTVVASGPPLVNPIRVVVDRNGDYIVLDSGAGDPFSSYPEYHYDAIFRVTRSGAITKLFNGSPSGFTGLLYAVAIAPDGSFRVGGFSMVHNAWLSHVWQIDPFSGGSSLLASFSIALGYINDMAVDRDGVMWLATQQGAGYSESNLVRVTADGRGVKKLPLDLWFCQIKGVALVPESLASGPASTPAVYLHLFAEFYESRAPFRLKVRADGLANTPLDLHVAILGPTGGFSFIGPSGEFLRTPELPWRQNVTLPFGPAAALDLLIPAIAPRGLYAIYAVLARAGADPRDSENQKSAIATARFFITSRVP